MFPSIINYNFLTTGSKLKQVSSIFACLHFIQLRITISVLQKPCQENFEKLQEVGERKFGGSEKDVMF